MTLRQLLNQSPDLMPKKVEIVIQDFDFNEYPVERAYKLGNKLVIQIGQPNGILSLIELEEKIEMWEKDYATLEKERDELSDELESIGSYEQVKSDKDELESLRDSFDQIEQSISNFATNADIRPTTNEADNIDMLHEKYMDLRKELDEADARKTRAEKANQKDFLASLLEKKRMAQLENLSVEEIQKQIDAL